MNDNPPIDFRLIRSVDGTQHGGFEELCVSLFREEIGDPFEIRRLDGSGGDGGVEAYFEKGLHITVGLQAKYWLGKNNWANLQASIKQARKNHPLLRTYYVAAPKNLTPAASRTWDALCKDAKAMRPALKLVWWGASELIHMLTQPHHMGRVSYWFGTRQFDAGWLDRQNRRARADLDTRYTPEHHVRVAAQDVLSAFSREPAFVTRYYKQAGLTWKTIHKVVDRTLPDEFSDILSAPFGAMKITASEELPRLGDGVKLPAWTAASDATQKLTEVLSALASATHAEARKADKVFSTKQSASGSYKASPKELLGFQSHDYSQASLQLKKFRWFLRDSEAMDRRLLLLLGEAGSGKSHLLADFVECLRKREQPALFVLGEYFTNSSDPWSQIRAILGWEGSVEELLGALNYAGEREQLPAIIVIDAVNETQDRAVWRSHLNAFAARLEKWQWVRLVISCRSDFAVICLPDSLADHRDEAWSYAQHRGFGEATFKATTKYFSAYQVASRDLPPLLPEFQNPLFLKTFCEAFENSEVPQGSITLDSVMRRRVDVACKAIDRAIDCPADVTWSALTTLAELIADHEWMAIPLSTARRAVDALFPGRGRSRSLFQHLSSSGLITEVGHYDHETGTSDVRVRFAYERFSDYFMAQRMLEGVRTVAELRQKWKIQSRLSAWDSWQGYLSHRGLLRALAILIPTRFELEVAELIESPELRSIALEDFMESLLWRDKPSITDRSHALFEEATASVIPESDVIRLLLRLASISGHPWNAEYLDAILKSMPLRERDLRWTIPISRIIDEESERSLPSTLVRWLFEIEPENLSDKQANLVTKLLFWFFSTNDRGFRKRATLAAIRTLQQRSLVVAELLGQFSVIDDPYVVERVFAVAAGVAVRERNSEALAVLSRVVWEKVFMPLQVCPHVLVRDYAFTVMECARKHGCLPVGVEKESYSPPYRSRWPKIWSDERAREFGKKKGWERIVHSIEPEYGNGIGGYGDFGRYIMESHIHHWLNTPLSQPFPRKDDRRGFDSLVARAWIMQRVAKLGWSPKRFGEYERYLGYGRLAYDREETKQERISKKYQWIALHELEALVSDRYYFCNYWNDEPTKYEGAWQLFSRDFDPAQPLVDPYSEEFKEEDEESEQPRSAPYLYPDPFRDRMLVKNPSAWVRAMPDDPKLLLLLDSAPEMDQPALMLSGWFSWDEPEPYPPRVRGMGKCHQYIHVRSWLVPKRELTTRLEFLSKVHFWGDGVLLPQFGSEGLGEYPWADRFKNLKLACEHEERWGEDFPVGYTLSSCCYSAGGRTVGVPSPQLADLLGLEWRGKDFEFQNKVGKLVAYAPLKNSSGHTLACFVDRREFEAMLEKEGLVLIWGLLGERHCFDCDAHQSLADSMVTFSGVCVLEPGDQVRGGITVREITELENKDGPRPKNRSVIEVVKI